MTLNSAFILASVPVLHHPDVLDLAELLEGLPQLLLLEAFVADDEEPGIGRLVVLRARVHPGPVIRGVSFASVVGHFTDSRARLLKRPR
jgi:hypothetical protein